MYLIEVDRAVARLERRLDTIMACTSGMPNFELVSAKVNQVRTALLSVSVLHPATLVKACKVKEAIHG